MPVFGKDHAQTTRSDHDPIRSDHDLGYGIVPGGASRIGRRGFGLTGTGAGPGPTSLGGGSGAACWLTMDGAGTGTRAGGRKSWARSPWYSAAPDLGAA